MSNLNRCSEGEETAKMTKRNTTLETCDGLLFIHLKMLHTEIIKNSLPGVLNQQASVSQLSHNH